MAPVTPAPLASVSPAVQPELLLVDASAEAPGYTAILRGQYRVATTTSADVAKQFLQNHRIELVLTELDLEGSDGVEVCRAAKALPDAPPVLVTTTQTERIPEALTAGCDGVLLKPFAPNLLIARVGRMLRERSESDRSEALSSGTNRMWPNTHCPYCSHSGVTSFEYCSHRRAWYACLECRKVWIAKRQE